MKTLSHMVLVAIAVITLSACQQSGSGPSKPANTNSTQISQQ